MTVRIRLMGTDRLELEQVEAALREVLTVPVPAAVYPSRRLGDPTLRIYLEATEVHPPSAEVSR